MKVWEFMTEFRSVYKKFLVRVTLAKNLSGISDDKEDRARIVFYTAATSTKHEYTLPLSDLSSVVGRQVETSELKFSSKEIQNMYEYLERVVPSLSTSSVEITEAETELKAIHALLREALTLEKENNYIEAIAKAKVCILSSRHAKLGLQVKGIKGGPLDEGVKSAISQAYNLMGGIYTSLGKKSKSIACYTLAAKAKPDSDMSKDMVAEALGNVSVADVDAHLEDFGLKALQDKAHFACNSCGECCRTRTEIFLSPHDVYAITRAPALSKYRIRSTLDLHSPTSFYKGVFKWSYDDWGFPSCFLSPASETAGHCRFSYPLFKRPGDIQRAGASHQTLTYSDTAEYLTFYGRSYEQQEQAWEDKEQAAKWLEEEEEMERRYGDVYPLMNRSGRQALGCMLGRRDMPLSCSSFPLVPESWYTNADGGSEEVDMSSEMFVVPKKGCEGFVREGEEGKEGKEEGGRAEQHFQDALPARSSTSSTVLEQAKPDERSYEEWRWFHALRKRMYLSLSTTAKEQLSSGSCAAVRKHFSHVLTQIWYNADILAHPSRPVKSYSRLRRDIWDASMDLVDATNTFFGPAYLREGLLDSEVERGYRSMVSALGLLKAA